ncbi:MAG: class II fructose-bisphosphate aldolase [bacterium]
MPLVDMRELLKDALKGKYAVGYFESWNMESLLAVVEAAEEEMSPVIIGFGAVGADRRWLEEGGIRILASLGLSVAQGASVPVSLIFNEASDFGQVVQAIKCGFNAVTMDSAHQPFEENVAITKKIVEIAHQVGVSVEAELGVLPVGAEGVFEEREPSFTDPEEASAFVDRTGVDALAVSIGNVHLLVGREARVDVERLGRIRDLVKVPLVIHGGSGFPEREVKRVIEHGVAKFNVGTILKKAFWDGLLGERIDTAGYLTLGSRKASDVLSIGRLKIKEEVKRLIKVYGSAGKAHPVKRKNL